MTQGIKLRAVTLADAPLLAEIHAASFGEVAWNLAQLEGSLALPTTQGWVSNKNGFILGQVTEERTEVLTFCVRPEARRLGIAKILLEQLLKSVSASGDSVFVLEAAADNHAARALYEKLGFRETGKRPGYYRRGAITVDAVLYEKHL